MCGLVGIAGNIGLQEEALFKDLLVMDTVRGYHSTGMAVIDSDREPEGATIFKLPVAGPDFVRHSMFSKCIPYTSACLIGHNRAATVGAINSFNAHPFHAGDIIGAHNGTIPMQAQKELEDYAKFTTDSEALLWNIHQVGVELTLGSIWGAWALTYWDFKKDRLCMVRNDQRPLAYVFTADRENLLWASEYTMLYAAAERNNIELEEAKILPINTVFEFDIPTYMAKGMKLPDPVEACQVTPGKPPSFSTAWSGSKKTTMQVGGVAGKTGIKSITYNPDGVIDLTPSKVIDTSLRQCDWCSASQKESEMHTHQGYDTPAYLCGDCFDDPTIQQYLSTMFA